MAAAMGWKVGIVTAAPAGLDLSSLAEFPIQRIECEKATTYENIQTPAGRVQYLHHKAPRLKAADVPSNWRDANIVHLGPVADEIDPSLVDIFPNSFLCITAQGCLRGADAEKRVHYKDWADAEQVLPHCQAAIISLEDVEGDEGRIQFFVRHCPVLAVTEGAEGTRIYWKGDVRRIRAPKVEVVDQTGSGDIFAAVFFSRLYTTRDPWLAGAQAVHLASLSVTRVGVQGVPTAQEVQSALTEILPNPIKPYA
jgi:sugar/nucleoside kinase (ribokinase family)